jgi:Spy/CpxP family protein refolding chaperone
MNTTGTRHTAATLATATAVAAALTIMSAIAPTAASADRPDPFLGPAPHGVGSVGGAGTLDIALEIAHRKALRAQYYVDHALELNQWAAL